MARKVRIKAPLDGRNGNGYANGMRGRMTMYGHDSFGELEKMYSLEVKVTDDKEIRGFVDGVQIIALLPLRNELSPNYTVGVSTALPSNDLPRAEVYLSCMQEAFRLMRIIKND